LLLKILFKVLGVSSIFFIHEYKADFFRDSLPFLGVGRYHLRQIG